MRVRVVVALLLASLFSMPLFSEEHPAPRIIGGFDATAQHSSFVALMAPWSWPGNGGGSHWNPFCGGTYIGFGLVVTAAHCVDDLANGSTIAMVFGNRSDDMEYEYCSDRTVNQSCQTTDSPDANISGYHFTGYVAYTGNSQLEIDLNTNNRIFHPDYRPSTFENDIAIIRVPGSVGAGTLLLPETGQWESLLATAGAKVTVIGHGNTVSATSAQFDADNGIDFTPSAQLQEVLLTPKADSVCTADYGSSFRSSLMLCAGDPNSITPNDGKDSCQGDSGGPLFNDGTLHGIVSWGGQCARQHGVYTDVLAMRPWLNVMVSVAQGQFEFPWLVDFGSESEAMQKTQQWVFTNKGAAAVTLSNFNFNAGSGFSDPSNGCNKKTLTSNESCTVTIAADFTNSGLYRSSFRFDLNGDAARVGLQARVVASSSNRLGARGGSMGYWLLLLVLPLAWVRFRPRRVLVPISLIALSLTGCAALSDNRAPVVVFNPQIDAGALAFSVVSTGCTQENHLYLRVRGDEIEVRRTQPDLCRAAPHLVRFEMPLPGSKDVWKIANTVRYSDRVAR